MTSSIFTHTYENGLVLLAEPMDWLESAAFTVLLPAGCCYDPADRPGLANFTCEMAQRGCGPRNSRQFVADLERLGVDRTASVSNTHTSFGGAMLAENLPAALSIYADLIRRPHLPEGQIDEGRLVCLQEVWAVEDERPHKVLIELGSRSYPDPWGRDPHGTIDAIGRISIDAVREQFQRTYQPGGAILSVAGKLDWPALVDHVGSLLADWRGAEPAPPPETPAPGGYRHLPGNSAQTHLGVAYPSVPYSHADFFQARGAVGVLSDGMSSRLFTEVREKRGLCYAVFASCHSHRRLGNVFCYAGTSTDRAQETLDGLLAELVRLSPGTQHGQPDRVRAQDNSPGMDD